MNLLEQTERDTEQARLEFDMLCENHDYEVFKKRLGEYVCVCVEVRESMCVEIAVFVLC